MAKRNSRNAAQLQDSRPNVHAGASEDCRHIERDPGDSIKREHDMKSPSDFELSRRKLLAGSAASVALSAAPSIAGAQAPVIASQAAVAEAPATLKVSFTVNGAVRDLTLDTRTTLLDALREHLHLT